MLRIVPIYAAVLALIYLVLAYRVIRVRQTERISLGAGDNRMLERQVRVHANFSEYAPFVLLLLAMAELRGAGAIWLHGLCIALLVGRVAHAAGVSTEPDNLTLRSIGMVGTFAGLVGGALLIFAT